MRRCAPGPHGGGDASHLEIGAAGCRWKVRDSRSSEGSGRELNPTWELGWFKGELVLMGKNQTVEILLKLPTRGLDKVY